MGLKVPENGVNSFSVFSPGSVLGRSESQGCGCGPASTLQAAVLLLQAETSKYMWHIYVQIYVDVDIYTHFDQRITATYGNLFLLNRFYLVLINNVLSINLSKSGPTMQIGGPSGGTGSIFFFTFGELKKKHMNLLIPYSHVTNLSVLELSVFIVSLY